MEYEPFFSDIALLTDSLRDRLIVHRFRVADDDAKQITALIIHVEAIQKRLERIAKTLALYKQDALDEPEDEN